MSIQRECKISQTWQYIQYDLLPFIEIAFGNELTPKQRQLITVLEMVKIEQFIPYQTMTVGRPPCNRQAIARSFIAKAIYNLTSTRALIDQLKVDIQLRRLCGWESTFPSQLAFHPLFFEYSLPSYYSYYHSIF